MFRRVIVPIFIVVVFLTIFPHLVFAQEPDNCRVIEYDFSTGNWNGFTNGDCDGVACWAGAPRVDRFMSSSPVPVGSTHKHAPTVSYANMYKLETDMAADMGISPPISGSITTTIYFYADAKFGYSVAVYELGGGDAEGDAYIDTVTVDDPGNYQSGNTGEDLAFSTNGLDWNSFNIWTYENYGAAITSIIQSAVITYCGVINPLPETCDTVGDAHFDEDDDTWLLTDGATITNSIVTLEATNGIAAQNLSTLNSNTPYQALISITEVITPAYLNVVLGIDAEVITITEPGIYTTSITTPNLGGPIGYLLENTSSESNTIGIDFTCLYDDSGEPECLMPINGEFNGDDNWDYYRGASYQPFLQNTFLPFNPGGDDEKSLIVSSSVYSLPELEEGEHLILKFTSETEYNQSGVLGSHIASAITDTTIFLEIYAYPYVFKTDISNMAGSENVSLAFANAGIDPFSGFSSEDNLFLDDICIYVSDDGNQLPSPIDPDPIIDPINLVCYTCADIPGILYAYGLDVYLLKAIYDNGISIWDYSAWVPWLAAALWVNAGDPLACFLLRLFCWWLGYFQYFYNDGLNWAHWGRRSLLSFITWLGLWQTFLSGSIINYAAWAWTTAYNWLIWFGTSLYNLATSPGLFLTALLPLVWWIYYGFLWLSENIGFPSLSAVFSGLAELIVWLWNMLVPLFETIWSFVSNVSLIGLVIDFLLQFVNAAWEMFIMVISWVWENIFMGISFPLDFYQAFDQGVKDESFSYLLECSGQNFWCSLLAGFQIINQTSSHSVIYPAVIVGVIIATIWVFWKYIRELFTTNVG